MLQLMLIRSIKKKLGNSAVLLIYWRGWLAASSDSSPSLEDKLGEVDLAPATFNR